MKMSTAVWKGTAACGLPQMALAATREERAVTGLTSHGNVRVWPAIRAVLLSGAFGAVQAQAQDATHDNMPPASGVSTQGAGEAENSSAPAPVTLRDAIERAHKVYAQYRAALSNVQTAQEDRVQARATLLPTLSYQQQYLGTQGNGRTPNGRFVTNDGVHVYRAWGVLHEDVTASTFTLAPLRRATAAVAQAQAQAEIAARGLTVTVTSSYYGLISAQKKYGSAQEALRQSQKLLEFTEALGAARELAHADVIKARLQVDQQQIAFNEARLAMENAHLSLAVLLSAKMDENFSVIDDTNDMPALPPFEEVRAMAARENPMLKAALASLTEAQVDVKTARAGYLPTFFVDANYGIEANAFALHSTSAAVPQIGKLPNLGYYIYAGLNLPVWNWGATGSKLHAAEYRRKQADVELTQAQRDALSSVRSYYNEARVARDELAILKGSADLAAESLRLSTLRYRAGEAPALEISDAQSTSLNAQRALVDGQMRYRVALATLQTVTGAF